MKLKIEEIYWSHNYMTGAHLESVVAESIVDVAVGPIPDFGSRFKGFNIDAVGFDCVTVTPPESDEAGKTTFTVNAGKPYYFCPRSRCGYKYEFSVIE